MPRTTSPPKAGAVPPVPPSSFHGRTEQLSAVAAAFEGSRLVTLTGPPGIGKTRLARKLAEDHPGGAAVVELAPIADPTLVPRALAGAVSVQKPAGQNLIDAVVAHLRPRSLLLVIDNCEHLIGACTEIIDTLLSRCPELRVVATSREPLGLTQERVWQVPPLAVPGPMDGGDPEALMNYEGVRLFVERARAVQPAFALTAYLASDVAEVCRRLDGIPLAIELAAARAEALTPAEIARRLDDRFGLLTTGEEALGRHETLEAALDWSHELLSDAERAMLRRLSVFVGGFHVEAAEAVCAGGEVDSPLDLLARLISKSLVVADTGPGSPTRYRLLETIRAYAAERLEEAGEVATLRAAHARFFLELAERAEPELTGEGQQGWLTRLEEEHENLRLALDWSLGQGEGESALRLGGALILFWRVRCHFTEGRRLLEAAIAATNGEAPPGLRSRALWGAGFLATMAADEAGARPLLEESLALATELGDLQGRARVLLILGNARQHRGDPEALTLLAQSAALAREAEDSWCLAHAVGCAGLEHCHMDELESARPLLEECVAVARGAQDKQGLRFGLLGLGEIAGRQGDHRAAEEIFQETVAVAEQLGEDYTKATALMYLGQEAMARGEYGVARERLDVALALIREAKPEEVVVSLVCRAHVARLEGDLDCARRLLDEALPLARAGAPMAAAAIQAMAELAVADENPRAARRLFEESLDLARSLSDTRRVAGAQYGLGELARSEGDAKRAAVLHNEALHVQRQIGNGPGIVSAVAAIGRLAAEAGHAERAVRLLGAANALRDSRGRGGVCERYEADLRLAGESLTGREFDRALAEGAALSLEEAARLAANGRGEGARPNGGWQSLTETERQVAELVAEGMTNSEIAKLLFVSPGTVKNHLSHIFVKLRLERRTELARAFLERENEPK